MKKMKNNTDKTNENKKLFSIQKNVTKKSILSLIGIVVCGLFIRFFYTPFDVPIILDGFAGYFLYTLDITRLTHLPNYTLAQSGWGEFLSLFFMNFHSENFIDYMNLQRVISVIISGVTIIPIYFICKKFFSEYYSLIGAIIFAFEPRIIINSTLGISEPLYILAISLGILLFLSSNKKIIYSSFGFFAWATIIRPEGQFWFVAFSIIYFLRFRKCSKDLIKYVLPLLIFALVLSPIVYHRVQCCDDDAIIGRILIELSNYSNNPEELNENSTVAYGPNWFSGIKLFGWALIPIFIIFIPLGLIPIFRKHDFSNYMLIVASGIMAAPILYSTSVAPDTRYVFPLFPIFCIISVFGIKWISDHFNNKKIILGFIIIAIIISSLVFLEYKKPDYTNSLESYKIAELIDKNVTGINNHTDVVNYYMKISQFSEQWSLTKMNYNWDTWLHENYKTKAISSYGDSLEEYIDNSKGLNLSHIITDNSINNPKFLLDVMNNEKKYPYLIKEFDSNENNFNYKVKVFKINYDIFENQKNKSDLK